MMMMDEVV